MSGMYGTIKPADIDINNDVEIFYHYRPSLNSDDSNFSGFQTLSPSILVPCTTDSVNGGVNISGLFNLKLPLDRFAQKGLYTIYIRPKEIDATIADVGCLAAFPDVRGITFNLDSTFDTFKSSNSLVGYRVEYLDGSGNKTGDFKIISSSNIAEPIVYILNNSSEKSSKFRFTMSGNMIFCTVTPSLAPTFKPTALPPIGNATQRVKLVNTKFNPIMIELEIVDHDEDTISYMLEGNQLIDKDKALITTFNNRGEIYHQSEYGVYKDAQGTPLYEFKKERDNIDFNQSLDNLE